MRAEYRRRDLNNLPLNESPSEKEGKLAIHPDGWAVLKPSMKVPPKRKGNPLGLTDFSDMKNPSMKVPPKRKGNPGESPEVFYYDYPLNESPSEKEGKCRCREWMPRCCCLPQ